MAGLAPELFGVKYVLVCVRALWRSMLVVVVLGVVAGGGLARASVVGHQPGRMAPASQVVLGSSFQPMKGVAGVVASGDYLLLSTTVSNGFETTGWIVINTRLGTTTALDPQCQVGGLGPPWVLMRCPPAANPFGPVDVELDSLADGTRRTVTPSPGVPAQCSDDETECASAGAVGAYWIRWNASCYHCAVTSFFQNIQTGELRDDPTNATTFADLNSPALAHRTCPGVRLTRDLDSYGRDWGSLTRYGQFAVAIGTNNSAFLERCGTPMRRLLVDGDTEVSRALASNSTAIVWQAVFGHLSGLFLPSLQTFTIPLPAAIVKSAGAPEDIPVGALELSSDALYVDDGWNGTTWRTASPTDLPRNMSRPSLTRSGGTLTCRRGSWRNAERFSYAWRVNGIAHKGANQMLAVGTARGRRSASCSVTASNVAGTTTASSAQLYLRSTPRSA
jgi:hypothetical protein